MKLPLLDRAWGFALRGVLLPAGDLYFRQGLMRRLRYLESAQWWERDRILGERDRLLRETVQAAVEAPFYRELFSSAGLNPSDVRGVADLRRLPIVTKDMLRPAYPSSATRPTGHKTYETCSSGSTGANFFVREDLPTAGFYRATFLLALEWAGWRFGEPHLQTGMTLRRSLDRKLKDQLMRCHYASAFDLTDAHLDAVLDEMDQFGLMHLWGYPGSLYYLARRAAVRGWNRSLRSAVTWGDTLFPHFRRTIESSFGVRVTDTYGCGEGFHIAAQCDGAETYHVHSLDVVLELVDDDGEPVPAGIPGHVVVTRLHAGPMPFLRYRVGDIALRGPDQLCPCGRGLERLGGIQGRDTDIVVTPAGNRLIVHFFTGILEFFAEVGCFQVVQEEEDAIIVRVVPAQRGSVTAETRRRIVAALHEKGAADLRIHVEPVDEIPTAPSGKRRFVISRLSKGPLTTH